MKFDPLLCKSLYNLIRFFRKNDYFKERHLHLEDQPKSSAESAWSASEIEAEGKIDNSLEDIHYNPLRRYPFAAFKLYGGVTSCNQTKGEP